MSPRKILEFLAWAVAAFVLLAVLGLGSVYALTTARMHKTYAIEVRPVAVPTGADALERGKHLATVRGCTECHRDDLAGGPVIDDPLVGHLHAPNLTRGRGGLPPEYSDLDFVRAIRHGVARDGRPLLLMPSHEFAGLVEADIAAIIAYVESVPAVDKPDGPVTVGPLARVLLTLGEIKIAAEEIDHAAAGTATVTAGVSPEYGHYLAASCVGCHNPSFTGGKIAGAPPDWPAAANLTAHDGAGIARWSEADFIHTLRTARRPDGTELNPVMPRVFGQMSDDELKAIWVFLRSLPPAATGQQS